MLRACNSGSLSLGRAIGCYRCRFVLLFPPKEMSNQFSLVYEATGCCAGGSERIPCAPPSVVPFIINDSRKPVLDDTSPRLSLLSIRRRDRRCAAAGGTSLALLDELSGFSLAPMDRAWPNPEAGPTSHLIPSPFPSIPLPTVQ